ncbi:MAG: carboxypeptidase-like regulatory domain-containing protein [Gemmatimonadota bacterium]
MRNHRAPGLLLLAPALGVLLVAAPGAAPAHAQVVWTTVVAKSNGRPVPRARVYLVREDGVAVDSALADGNGRARLAADSAGMFVLYAHIEGFAAFSSSPFRLRNHEMLQRDFALPLIPIATLQRIGDMVHDDPMLHQNLATICGEKPRAGAGIVMGVVRARGGQTPVAGVLVSLVPPPPDSTAEAANKKPRFRPVTGVSNDHGTFVLCNVPAGDASLQAHAAGWRPGSMPFHVQAGVVLWQNLTLDPAPAPPDRPEPPGRPLVHRPGPAGST